MQKRERGEGGYLHNGVRGGGGNNLIGRQKVKNEIEIFNI